MFLISWVSISIIVNSFYIEYINPILLRILRYIYSILIILCKIDLFKSNLNYIYMTSNPRQSLMVYKIWSPLSINILPLKFKLIFTPWQRPFFSPSSYSSLSLYLSLFFLLDKHHLRSPSVITKVARSMLECSQEGKIDQEHLSIFFNSILYYFLSVFFFFLLSDFVIWRVFRSGKKRPVDLWKMNIPFLNYSRFDFLSLPILILISSFFCTGREEEMMSWRRESKEKKMPQIGWEGVLPPLRSTWLDVKGAWTH